ncbi:MAG: VPLPA-CTERM sorting domain-containing protein [Nitrospira sp.]|nr:VPLPA-CTERM sorting domain-containing protein [Nitrospira sp.]
MKVRGIKRAVMASVLAIATAVAGQAQAFTFGDGDLVLAIYGNSTEALYNLGNYNTRLGSGATFDFDASAGLAAAQVGGSPVKYTVFGWDTSLTNGQIHAATSFTPAQLTGTKDFGTQFINSAVWSSQPLFAGDTISKTDSLNRSFSQNLNTSGSGQFEGAWPLAMQGNLDQVLNIMRGDVETSAFTQVGRVLLTAGGLLTIGNPGPNLAAVPLPAGVVLFGSGLIGLVGIARRKFAQMAA